MPKPSMFSKDYEKLMRRRRINIILVILIIISAGFFGIRYYLQGKNIDFLDNIFKKTETGQKDPAPEATPTAEPTVTPTETPKQENSYKYTSSNGESYEISYETTDVGIAFKGIKSSYQDLGYDISQDKQYIVFEDRAAADIMLMSADGKAIKINPSSYYSKTSSVLIKKEDMLAKLQNYIWSARPHFTSDNRVVFLTDIPYLYDDGKLYMWTVSISGQLGSLIGGFETKDRTAITYEGYREDGSLIISFNNITYYYKPNTKRLSQ
jgi:hypothetical protein